jgi:hypothetical protein
VRSSPVASRFALSVARRASVSSEPCLPADGLDVLDPLLVVAPALSSPPPIAPPTTRQAAAATTLTVLRPCLMRVLSGGWRVARQLTTSS